MAADKNLGPTIFWYEEEIFHLLSDELFYSTCTVSVVLFTSMKCTLISIWRNMVIQLGIS